MAKAKKTTKAKTTKAKSSKANTSSANAYTNAYAQAAKSAKSAYNFADTSSFMNPQQFFSAFTKGQNNFQPANVQQWFEQFAETSQKNMETLTACAQIAAEHTKDLLEDQANFMSTFAQEAATSLQTTLTSNADPKDKMEEIAEYTKYCLEKTTTAARKAAEGNMEIAQKIGDKLKKRATDAVEELRSAA